MLTTLVMLYGFSFLYGLTRHDSATAGWTSRAPGLLGVLALLFALVGLLAKLSAAPFHYWAPDAYAGATPWTRRLRLHGSQDRRCGRDRPARLGGRAGSRRCGHGAR